MDFTEMMGKREGMKKKAAEFVTAGSYKKDERFWEATTGKDGNGSALFRFLPQKNFELNPVARRIRHTFKLKGKQFFDYCPKTLGWDEECPVCDDLAPLYDDYQDTPNGKKYTHQAQIDLLKRKNEHITNIYMIDDPAKPENNGKVFLFRMNGIILDLYKKAINPPAEMITPKIVYDYIEGCNFQYIVIGPMKKGDFNDYKSSNFQAISPIADTQEKMNEIWNESYELDEFIDPKQFKSYDDINAHFRKIYYNEAQSRDIPGGIQDDKSTQMSHPFEPDKNIEKTDENQPDPDVDNSAGNIQTDEANKEFSFNTPDTKKEKINEEVKIEKTDVTTSESQSVSNDADHGFKF